MTPAMASTSTLAPPMPCGLLILTRRDDTEILLLHGEGRPLDAGERLAFIEWFPSVDAAAAVSRSCSQLLVAARSPPDRDGWHRFATPHLRTLLGAARNNLNGASFAPEQIPRRRQAWTGERVARLGFLAGMGFTAKKIADDPLIRSTPNNVYRQAHRFGIALSDAPQGHTSIRLPLEVQAVYDKAAERAQLTRNVFVRRFLIATAAQPETIDLFTC